MSKKSNKKLREALSFTIEGGHKKVKMEDEQLQSYLKERSRGCGSHKSVKDYKRRDKHQKRYF